MNLSATPAEWAWAAAATVCFGLTAENCRQAWRDWRANRGREALFYLPAVAELESQASYLLVQGVFLGLGVAALLTPEPQTAAVDAFHDAATAALVVAEVILALRSAQTRWRRHQLDHAIRDHAEHGGYVP